MLSGCDVTGNYQCICIFLLKANWLITHYFIIPILKLDPFLPVPLMKDFQELCLFSLQLEGASPIGIDFLMHFINNNLVPYFQYWVVPNYPVYLSVAVCYVFVQYMILEYLVVLEFQNIYYNVPCYILVPYSSRGRSNNLEQQPEITKLLTRQIESIMGMRFFILHEGSTFCLSALLLWKKVWEQVPQIGVFVARLD